jgi:phosphatidylserine/phosphatidylglycerophosphate/cardiolipin synthase-like enzyme
MSLSAVELDCKSSDECTLSVKHRKRKKKTNKNNQCLSSQLMHHLKRGCQTYDAKTIANRFIPINEICTQGNQLLAVAHQGPELFEYAEALLCAARCEINMIFYVWDNGCDAARAIGRGIQYAQTHFMPTAECPRLTVRIIVRETQLAPNSMLNELCKTKQRWIEECNFQESLTDLHLCIAPNHAFGALHSKYIIVDRQLLFVTGANVETHFDRKAGHWNDAAFLLAGPCAQSAMHHFACAWNQHCYEVVPHTVAAHQTKSKGLNFPQRLKRLLFAPLSLKALASVASPCIVQCNGASSQTVLNHCILPKLASTKFTNSAAVNEFAQDSTGWCETYRQLCLERWTDDDKSNNNTSDDNGGRTPTNTACQTLAKNWRESGTATTTITKHKSTRRECSSFPVLLLSKPPHGWFEFKVDQLYHNDPDQAIFYLLLRDQGCRDRLDIVNPNINDQVTLAALSQWLHRGHRSNISSSTTTSSKRCSKSKQCQTTTRRMRILTNVDFNEKAEEDLFQPGGNFESVVKLVNHCPQCVRDFREGNLQIRWYSADGGKTPVQGNLHNVNHTKAMFVDNRSALVGSQNLDQQSMQFSDETNLFIDSVPATREMQRVLWKQQWANAIPFCVPTWEEFVQKIKK